MLTFFGVLCLVLVNPPTVSWNNFMNCPVRVNLGPLCPKSLLSRLNSLILKQYLLSIPNCDHDEVCYLRSPLLTTDRGIAFTQACLVSSCALCTAQTFTVHLYKRSILEISSRVSMIWSLGDLPMTCRDVTQTNRECLESR